MLNNLLISSEFMQGLWQGLFELLALIIVAYFVNVLYAKYSTSAQKKQEIIDELDEFVISLWKPRKIYTLLQEDKLDFLNKIENKETKDLECYKLHQQAFKDLLDSIGRLRAVQIKLVSFFGFQVELLSHFTAIWLYLKEVRRRMERGETLFFGSPRKMDATSSEQLEPLFFKLGDEKSSPKLGADDLYVLIDKFRLLISSTPRSKDSIVQLAPPKEFAKQIQSRAQSIYENFFGNTQSDGAEEAFFGEVLAYNVDKKQHETSLVEKNGS